MAAGIWGHERSRLVVYVLLFAVLMTATVGLVGLFCQPAHAALGVSDTPKITALIYPTLGNPAIIEKGQEVVLEFNPRWNLNNSGPNWTTINWSATITTTNESFPATYNLEYVSVAQELSQVWPNLASGEVFIHRATFKVPANVPEHLYDLTVNCTWDAWNMQAVPPTYAPVAMTDMQPHGLQVIDQYKTDFNFCQLTDIHVFGPENPNPSVLGIDLYKHSQHERGQRRTTYDPVTEGWGARYYHKTINQLNRVRPDFVVYTGDYDFGQRYFQQTNAERGYGNWGTCTEYEFEQEWFYQETLALDVPVFIVIGNHDGYFEGTNAAHEDWFNNWRMRYGPLFFSFDYGSAHFTCLNTMDWASTDRTLTDWMGAILQPEKYKGQVKGGGDAFEAGISQQRLAALDENNYTQQLAWARDDLIAHQSSSIRMMAFHHDPWKTDGEGSMWSSGSGGWMETLLGTMNMGDGEGRLALIKLMVDHNVALSVSGHDHSDIVGTCPWTNGLGTTIHANTTSTAFQDDGPSTSYPGYRRVFISNGQVATYNYPDNNNSPYVVPSYNGCNIGGTTDLTTLSTPAVESTWSTSPASGNWGTVDNLTNTINNHLAANQNNCNMVFPMPYLSGGYYYQLTNGTWDERWDNNAGTKRMHSVYTNVLAGQNKAVRVFKSAAPDLTGPAGTLAINGGLPSTMSLDVTLNITASDAASGLRDMMVSNDAGFAGAAWRPYQTSIPWSLSAGAFGNRTVYIKFRDWAMPENQSPYSDTIEYSSTPADPPTVTSIAPATGNAGTTVTVTDLAGTGFWGAPSVKLTKNGQTDIVATGVAVQSPTRITCSFPVPFYAASGAWNVVVTNTDAQYDSLLNGFTVTYGPPSIATVTPNTGLAGTTVSNINLDGTGFRMGATVKLHKDGFTDMNAVNVSVENNTRIICDVTLPPNPTNLVWDVVVNNTDGGSGTKANGFTIQVPPPTVTAITPSSGGDGESVSVTNLAGTGFSNGAAVKLTRAGQTDISATGVNVASATRITCTLPLPVGAQAGTWNVIVTNADTQAGTLSNGFTLVNYPAPTVTGINPNNGRDNEVKSVTVSGTNFRAGLSARLTKSGTNINATSIASITATSFTCNFDLNGKAPGAWTVEVFNSDGKSPVPLVGGFTISATPHVTAITPGSGSAGSSIDITNLVGTGFWGTPSVKLTRAGQPDITATSVVVVSSTRITCTFALPLNALRGLWNVKVTNQDNEFGTGANLFTVNYAAPTIATVTPNEGEPGTTVSSVSIVGTGFRAGATARLKKTGENDIAGTAVTVQSDTQVTCDFTLPPEPANLVWDVVVQNNADGDTQYGTRPGGFTIVVPPPIVDSITPATGDQGRTVSVTSLAGHGFRSGAAVKLAMAGQSDIVATGVNVVSVSQITCSIAIPKTATMGAWDVVVTNIDTKSDTLAGAFTIVEYPAPNVTQIVAASAYNNAPVSVTITGSFFRAGITARLRNGGSTLTATGIQNLTANGFDCTFDIGEQAVATWDVEVENVDGKKSAPGTTFEITAAPAATLDAISPSAAAVGDTITLTGTEFGSSKSISSHVDFAGAEAVSYSEWTDTEIKCLVPAGAQSGSVSVTVAGNEVGDETFTLYNTPKGTRVAVDVETHVQTVFSTVSRSGQTDALEGTQPTLKGFSPMSGTQHTISTTAAFTGNVTITIMYDSFIPADLEARLVLIQKKGSAWTQLPSTIDTKNNKVSGTATALGDFMLAVPLMNTTWYLAEGTSDWGFVTYINIQNPNSTAVTAKVSYMTKSGEKTRPDLVLAPRSQTVINPANDVGTTDFSTKVECVEEKPIAVDRRMIWTGPNAAASEGHASVGVTSPATQWFLPEGSAKWGFETWLLVQNPNDTPANCDITYMTDGAGPKLVKKVVPAKSRASYNMSDDIGALDASIKVSSNVPVIPERAMYRYSRREGHDSIGTSQPANDYYLAEGTTGYGFTTFVLVQNPGSEAANITLTYMTNEGPVTRKTEQMQPYSRKTINVNTELPGKDLSIKVHSDRSIIAERAMYWNSPAGESCHDSIGMPQAHTAFYLPDGETYNGHETWTLVQNPNSTDVKVDVTYMTPDGSGNKTVQDQVIPANSRKSFFMADSMPDSRCSVLVTCKTTGKKIMVERAMYWNQRCAGTDTIGGYSD